MRFAQVLDDRHVRVVSLSTEGKPLSPSEDTQPLLLHMAERRSLLWSNGGILGIAESTYPHPAGWTLAGADKGNLETFTVRQLTAIIRDSALGRVAPSCISAWASRGIPIHPYLMSLRYKTGLITPNEGLRAALQEYPAPPPHDEARQPGGQQPQL